MEQHSLSWYKKRTAAINKALGTQYSPTEIYRAEQIKGHDTDIGRALEELGDPRSAAAQQNVEASASVLVKQQWSALASANAYVYWVSDSIGGFISADGTAVYQKNPAGDWYAIDIRTGNAFIVGRPPESAIKLTAKTANELIKAKAQELKPFKNRKGESVNNYLYD